MIKTSWNKTKKLWDLAKRRIDKVRDGIPAKYMRRPWPSGNKSRNH